MMLFAIGDEGVGAGFETRPYTRGTTNYGIPSLPGIIFRPSSLVSENSGQRHQSDQDTQHAAEHGPPGQRAEKFLKRFLEQSPRFHDSRCRKSSFWNKGASAGLSCRLVWDGDAVGGISPGGSGDGKER